MLLSYNHSILIIDQKIAGEKHVHARTHVHTLYFDSVIILDRNITVKQKCEIECSYCKLSEDSQKILHYILEHETMMSIHMLRNVLNDA